MSDYQRFITYINLYENDDKRKNVGFAKIEKRKEQCRFEIHMKNIGYTGQNSQIYFYVRHPQELECIPVGNLQIINGIADRRIMLNGDNIAGSGRRLEEISGLVIFLNEQIMLASQWQEGEMLRRLFRLPGQEPAADETAKEPAAKPSQGQTPAPPASPVPPQKQAAVPPDPSAPSQRQAAVSPVPLTLRQNRTAALAPSSARPAPPLVHAVPLTSSPASANTASSVPASMASPASANTASSVPASKASPASSVPASKASPASSVPAGKASQASADTALPAPETADPAAPQAQEQSASLHVAEAAVSPAPRPWSATWQMMLESYPVLTPFEGDEDICCIRIELKELRMLPRRYWYLGNNSFLLHGFFNYRYLILGQMQIQGVKRWFLGVPGVFQNQEKVMAAIFGFPEFKAEKTAKQKTNQFGYWYRFMDESD